jgi:drug/metabolite transporter (DMT)-like permease
MNDESGQALRRAIPLVVLLTIVWGTNWPLFAYAVREVSVWTFRSVSVLGAGLVLLAWAKWQGHRLRIAREHWGTLVASALVYLVVWNVASTYAALAIPSGQAAILGFTMPLWLAAASWIFWRQQPQARVMAALALGSAGVGLLIWRGADAYAAAPTGFALGLAAALGWALGTLILKARPIAAPSIVTTGWQLVIAAIPITLGALHFGSGSWFLPSASTVLVIADITLVPMAIGNVAWFSIVNLLPANVAGLMSVMVPVVAMVSGAWIHGEPLGLLQWTAASSCVAGLLLVLWRSAPKP